MAAVTPDGRTLVLLRHAKSDWAVHAPDVERSLSKRGTRQAAEAGRWLARHVRLDLALVSEAERARRTWELASAELPSAPPSRPTAALYTFDGADVLRVARGLPEDARSVLLVGHNPAFEETVDRLTGEMVEMTTSAIAVIQLGSWADAGTQPGRLVAHGRPPT